MSLSVPFRLLAVLVCLGEHKYFLCSQADPVVLVAKALEFLAVSLCLSDAAFWVCSAAGSFASVSDTALQDCTGLHGAKGKPISKSKQMSQKLGRTVWYPLPSSASQCVASSRTR